jgi:nucleoside-diphosphate-sugar epimerase
MKALVSGSAGFVGRHFVDYLQKRSWTVDGIDPAHRWDTPWHGDCRDSFRKWGFGHEYDLVVHCAATIPSVDERAANGLSVSTDFALDAEMFQWALRARPKKIVYFSSSAAYPARLGAFPTWQTESQIHLDRIETPDGMYGLTKLVGEIQAREALKAGLDVLVVRPQSGYGWDQSLNYPFPSFIDRAKRYEDPFIVWGTGEQTRDFVHVQDIVECVMAMLAADYQGPVNIGTGIGTSMIELAQKICREVNYQPRIVTLPEKPIGTAYRSADPMTMLEFYEPKVSLEQGIREAVRKWQA